jgi:hypothetical protein
MVRFFEVILEYGRRIPGEQTEVAKILTKWFLFTRLETRTKECKVYASVRAANPDAK